MSNKSGVARIVFALLAAALLFSILSIVAIGCGDENGTDTKADTKAGTQAVGALTGKVYVASGEDGKAFAIVDLATKKVEMVNLPEAMSPHGIIPAPDTDTTEGSQGRNAEEEPETLYLGNQKDGKILKIDVKTKSVLKVIDPPADAKMQVCGMELGPDGKIWVTSMGDGKAYPLDPETDTIGAGIAGGDITKSVCGIVWSEGNEFVYLSNMSDPDDPAASGYVAKLTWPEGELVKKIENVTQPQPGKVVAHQAGITPDKKFMYVTDSGAGALIKIDLATDEIVKSIPIGGKEIHSIVFSEDGKTAFLAVRAVPDASQSSVFVYDVAKDQVIDQIPGLPSTKVCGIIVVQA